MDELTVEWIAAEKLDETIHEIIGRYGQGVLQLVYSYVGNKAIAEDLTQEIFIKCYRSLHTYKGQAQLKTWLWRIAINHCKDFLKSWYNRNVISTDNHSVLDSSQKRTVEQSIIQKDDDAKLAFAVMNLPIIYREVILLHYYEELAIKEISTILDVKVNTIKTRLRKAKALLKESLEE
ncbi:sigma-70 family RNA polymerase sigma factor [Bacillus sp. Bva_UNVM-123]|uniref:sigma-70 family RNA polymerase sigma factor n=1 Tax=Bacillus sp. Bva_UNVM-123 TaxID=2829798 RepID=UPI00391FB548